MTPETELALIQAVAALPASGLLVAVIYGLVSGAVVTRKHHEEVCQEKDEQITWLQTQVDRLQNGQATKFNLP